MQLQYTVRRIFEVRIQRRMAFVGLALSYYYNEARTEDGNPRRTS